ncbi:MAG: ribosome maturation factor RimP [Schwartzia sp.]|nr:ribosome maturation factor RimP [Schwartzia sp. (in: firmicutes)]
MANAVEKEAERLAKELLTGSGIELVDVEYVRERDWYLRVFIDKEGGIDIEDCQSLSERLEKLLDERDTVPESYILEVSSPGLDRVLKKPRDFERERGKTVDVTLYEPLDGQKIITGELAAYDGKELVLAGREPIPKEKVAQVRLHIDF